MGLVAFVTSQIMTSLTSWFFDQFFKNSIFYRDQLHMAILDIFLWPYKYFINLFFSWTNFMYPIVMWSSFFSRDQLNMTSDQFDKGDDQNWSQKPQDQSHIHIRISSNCIQLLANTDILRQKEKTTLILVNT